MRRLIPALLASVVLASSASAEAPWRFRWQTGQVLTYRVEQVTTISEVVGAKQTEVTTRLNLVKRWQVGEVDASGGATLHLSLAAMRNEITRPDGEVLLFDSQDADRSTPGLREQLAKYVGTTLAVVRVDAKGNVVEVKESKHGPASRYESELPFRVALPDGAVAVGEAWSRAYKVVLDPPQGTGEKYDARQDYACKAIDGPLVKVGVTTALSGLPESVADQVPLLQAQPEGEVVFDAAAGLVKGIALTIDKELKGHQGEGSSYRFRSTYREEYAGDR
jgi:hypothetical protein